MPIEALPELTPNFRPKRRFYLGQGGPLDANLLFYMPPDEKRSREEWRARRAEELAAQHNLEHLATIWEEHVAAWSVKKFAAIMTICDTLQAEAKSRRTSVVRLLAPRSAMPLPHTWGEVALIKARIVCGSWRPENRLGLKIIHGRTLLGQAMLESWGLRGEDKSDLPKNQRPRPTFWELRLEDGSADEWYERSLLDEVIEPMFLSALTDSTS